MTAIPIACTLSAADLGTRTAALSALAERALLTREPIDHGERLTFRNVDDVERHLIEAVAAEAQCCAFLTMRLEAAGDVLALEVTGPEDAGPIIAELFA